MINEPRRQASAFFVALLVVFVIKVEVKVPAVIIGFLGKLGKLSGVTLGGATQALAAVNETADFDHIKQVLL